MITRFVMAYRISPGGRSPGCGLMAAISRPHLSNLAPHTGHVHPPHITSRSDWGSLTLGRHVLQRGQPIGSKLIPHLFLAIVPCTTRIPPSISSTMKAARIIILPPRHPRRAKPSEPFYEYENLRTQGCSPSSVPWFGLNSLIL